MNIIIPPSPSRSLQTNVSGSTPEMRATHTMKDDIALFEEQKKNGSSRVSLREQKKKELIRSYSFWQRITGKASAEAGKLIEEEERIGRELAVRAKEEEEMARMVEQAKKAKELQIVEQKKRGSQQMSALRRHKLLRTKHVEKQNRLRQYEKKRAVKLKNEKQKH